MKKNLVAFIIVAVTAFSAQAATEKKVIASYDFSRNQKPASWGNESTSEISEIDGASVLSITNPSAVNAWNVQLQLYNNSDEPLVQGATYYVAMRVKGSKEESASLSGFIQTASYGTSAYMSSATVTNEWSDATINGVVGSQGEGDATRIVLNLGAYDGSLYFSSLEVYAMVESEPVATEQVVLASYDFEDGRIPTSWGNGSSKEIVTDGSSKVLKFTNPSAVNSYSVQMQLYQDVDNPLTPEETYYVSMRVKGSESTPANIGGYLQAQNYSTNASLTTISVTDQWQDVVMKATTKAEAAGAQPATKVLLNLGVYVGDIYFDDIKVYYEKKETTGIEDIVSDVDFKDNRVYNLQGVMVKVITDISEIYCLPTGLYIVNGKKYVVK